MSPPTDRAMGLAQISMSVGQCHDFSLDSPGVRGTPERKNSMFLGGNTHGGVLNRCNASAVLWCQAQDMSLGLLQGSLMVYNTF